MKNWVTFLLIAGMTSLVGCGEPRESVRQIILGTTVERGKDGVITIKDKSGEILKCVSDNWIQAGDFVTSSAILAGDCHDTGIRNEAAK